MMLMRQKWRTIIDFIRDDASTIYIFKSHLFFRAMFVNMLHERNEIGVKINEKIVFILKNVSFKTIFTRYNIDLLIIFL